jgi:hypothetical protein
MTIALTHDLVDVLAELHDSYVWDLNAALAEGRDDLVRDLSDDYFERSVRLMIGQQPPDCGRPGCVMCPTRSAAAPSVQVATHHRWWHRLHR